MSPILDQSIRWWIDFLPQMPTVKRTAGKVRPHVRTWTDACGENNEICAMMLKETPAGPVFKVAHCRVPQSIMKLFLHREDKYIQCTEFLAVLMAWKVFEADLWDCDWTAYVDNQAVIGTVTRGSAANTAEDITYLVGNLWTEVAKRQVDLNLVYVHSPSNPADGPTRGDWSLVRQFGYGGDSG